MSKTLTITLDTGTLHLDVEPGRVPLNRLLGFAARVSSKRKFLLVSKVLGKHYPVSPKLMSWSYRALARAVLKSGIVDNIINLSSAKPSRQLLLHYSTSCILASRPAGEGEYVLKSTLLSAGSLWIGMAETATGLGYGVFEAACREGAEQALFIQTTRYHLDGVERLEFEEAHSHATDFFLYYPEQPSHRQQFLTAETLVLIDDEISTGLTFLRLIKAYQRVNPHLRKVFIVSLVNFAHPDDRTILETEAGVTVEWVCFRQGLLRFEDKRNAAIDSITVNVSGNGACKKTLLAWPGRLGLDTPISLETDVVEQLSKHGLDRDQRPVLVLGTGECNAPAYLLGRELESQGFKVKVQSTTRSPIHQGNDIGLVCRFEDNYDDGIANFIYNLNPDDYRNIILCHETPLCESLIERLHTWQAISARFELQANTPNHAKLHFFRP